MAQTQTFSSSDKVILVILGLGACWAMTVLYGLFSQWKMHVRRWSGRAAPSVADTRPIRWAGDAEAQIRVPDAAHIYTGRTRLRTGTVSERSWEEEILPRYELEYLRKHTKEAPPGYARTWFT